MRSQQCNRLKERQRFHFDLLQNQLIAVGCRANSVSKAAGMVPSTGGCPLARVNGSGVGERNCGECRKNKIKNFSAWISQSNAGSKNRGQYHNDILIWRALAMARMRVIRSVRLASCLISAQNHRQRSPFDLFAAPNCRGALSWLVYTQTQCTKVTGSHTLAQNRKMKAMQRWAEGTQNLFVILAELAAYVQFSKRVYLSDPKSKPATAFLCSLNLFWYFLVFCFPLENPLSLNRWPINFVLMPPRLLGFVMFKMSCFLMINIMNFQ